MLPLVTKPTSDQIRDSQSEITYSSYAMWFGYYCVHRWITDLCSPQKSNSCACTNLFLHSHQTFSRNSIIGDEYRWPTTIPYYLEDSLGTLRYGNSHSQYLTCYYRHASNSRFFLYNCVTCRYECKGGDPEGIWAVQTEDLYWLHTMVRRGELHLCVQGQRVSGSRHVNCTAERD